MTLTEVAYYSRKFAPFAVLGMVFVLILFYSFVLLGLLAGGNTKKQIEYDTVFDKISPPFLSKTATTSAGFSFVLDTVEGQPISATAAAKVYYLPEGKFQFDYQPKIYVIAKTLGFNTELVRHTLSGNDAIFEDELQRLVIDIRNYNFRYEYNFQKDGYLMESAVVPDAEEAKNKAVDFLKSINRYPNEFAAGKTNTVYFSYDKIASRSAQVEEARDASLIEIDFYRPDIDTFPVVPPSYFNSQNFVLIVPTENTYRVVAAQVKNWEKSTSQIGTYPLMTGKDAYEELLAGKGVLISRPEDGSTDVAIKKMFLGYLDPDTYQEYLQPIFIFLGDKGFVSYIPAVSREYMKLAQ